MYSVELSPRAVRDLRALPDQIRKRIGRRIDDLREEPRPDGCKKLSDGTYRVRVGDYRIVYDISDAVLRVLILKVGGRGDIYR